MPHRCGVSRLYLLPVPNYWTWTKTTPQTKQFFWSNPDKTEVVESHDKILLVMSSTEIMTPWPLFQNIVILRRPGVAIFADIIKIITRSIKQIFKDSGKAKRTRNCVLKCNLYLYFLIWQSSLISSKRLLCQQKSRCVMWFIYFLDLL